MRERNILNIPPSPPSLPADHILLTADADVDKYQEHAFLMNLSICLNAQFSLLRSR